MAGKKKNRYEEEPLEVLQVLPDVRGDAWVQHERDLMQERWAKQHFKNRVVHQLLEKLTLLPDEPTCDAVISKAEYICRGAYRDS